MDVIFLHKTDKLDRKWLPEKRKDICGGCKKKKNFIWVYYSENGKYSLESLLCNTCLDEMMADPCNIDINFKVLVANA